MDTENPNDGMHNLSRISTFCPTDCAYLSNSRCFLNNSVPLEPDLMHSRYFRSKGCFESKFLELMEVKKNLKQDMVTEKTVVYDPSLQVQELNPGDKIQIHCQTLSDNGKIAAIRMKIFEVTLPKGIDLSDTMVLNYSISVKKKA